MRIEAGDVPRRNGEPSTDWRSPESVFPRKAAIALACGMATYAFVPEEVLLLLLPPHPASQASMKMAPSKPARVFSIIKSFHNSPRSTRGYYGAWAGTLCPFRLIAPHW